MLSQLLWLESNPNTPLVQPGVNHTEETKLKTKVGVVALKEETYDPLREPSKIQNKTQHL